MLPTHTSVTEKTSNESTKGISRGISSQAAGIMRSFSTAITAVPHMIAQPRVPLVRVLAATLALGVVLLGAGAATAQEAGPASPVIPTTADAVQAIKNAKQSGDTQGIRTICSDTGLSGAAELQVDQYVPRPGIPPLNVVFMQVNSAAVAAYPGASKVVVTQSGVEQGEGRVPDIGFWSSPQASLARGASTATLSWFVNNAGGTRAYEYNVASGEIGNLGDPVLGTPDTQFAVQVEVRGPENQLLAADSLNCTGSAASIALPITTR